MLREETVKFSKFLQPSPQSPSDGQVFSYVLKENFAFSSLIHAFPEQVLTFKGDSVALGQSLLVSVGIFSQTLVGFESDLYKSHSLHSKKKKKGA